MKIPANINFKEMDGTKYIQSDSSEYSALKKMNDDGLWKDYCNELLSRGISSRYDVTSDLFIIKPVAFNSTLNEAIDLEDIDIEDDDLESIEDEDEETMNYQDNIDSDTNEEINNTMQVVSLEDVLTLIRDVTGKSDNIDPLATDKGDLKAGEEDLKNTYFQSTGNETLDSEFNEIDTNMGNFKDKSETESYITQLGSTTNEVDHEGITDPMEILNKLSFDQEGPVEVDSFSTDVSAFDHMPYDYESEDANMDCMPDMETPGSFKNTLDNFYNQDHDLYTDNNEQDEDVLLDDEFAGESYAHPDIERISGDMDYSDEDEYDEPIEIIDEPAIAPSGPAPVDVNKVLNIMGSLVQVMLSGVSISANELGFISESVKKTGNKLKAINGVGNKLQIVVESAGKQYTINYEDAPSYMNPLPFSIKRYKFKTLQESLQKINYSVDDRQNEIFKSIINEDHASREINILTESDIFEKKQGNYMSSWNVQNIGNVNLKNCLNEKYSNITLISKEPNTLIKDSNDNYYVILGNLKERSKAGTKRELVENTIKKNKNYGACEVIGAFDNTAEGLGEIMYITKKGALPLLVWK